MAAETTVRVSEMAQWVKVIAAKPDYPSSIPGTRMVEEEKEHHFEERKNWILKGEEE